MHLASQKPFQIPSEREDAPRCQKRLGEGTYGEVFAATYQNREMAVKRLKQINQFGLHQTQYTELIVAQSLSINQHHNNIVNTEFIYVQNQLVHLAMEFCDCMLIKIFEQRLTKLERKAVYKQTLEGLQYLHHNNFLHCDLKPQNIMVRFMPTGDHQYTTQIKIGDFGMGEFINQRSSGSIFTPHKDFKWTAGYRPPEIICGYTDLCLKSDVWSLGVTFLELQSGKNIFASLTAERYEELYNQKFSALINALNNDEEIESSFEFMDMFDYDADEREFLQAMLEFDVRKRLNCDELLEHPFLHEDFGSVYEKVGQGMRGELMKLKESQFAAEELEWHD
ncbi:Kinase [Hexamita inflata]|uniref:Kinase n=1 Tax=Hexamita inflata TaxID=28002 RepID=A0ABP1GGH8_9EUKA